MNDVPAVSVSYLSSFRLAVPVVRRPNTRLMSFPRLHRLFFASATHPGTLFHPIRPLFTHLVPHNLANLHTSPLTCCNHGSITYATLRSHMNPGAVRVHIAGFSPKCSVSIYGRHGEEVQLCVYVVPSSMRGLGELIRRSLPFTDSQRERTREAEETIYEAR